MNDVKRYVITLTGIVQGVGFRPFVFRTAKQNKLNGWVENQGSRVVIDIEGKENSITEFIRILKNDPPKNAEIIDFNLTFRPVCGYSDFNIKLSDTENNTANFLPSDTAVCDSCMEEFNTFGNKRYKYPFISCTDCGPRYSIIKALPYDRGTTSMEEFKMCPECNEEYTTAIDKRFHAQTNCCPNCGPTLKLIDSQGNNINSQDPAKEANRLISEGNILAVKGIGGYHLCCNAQSSETVQRLRNLKNRPHKPLAVMARNMETVNKICEVSEVEKKILTGNKKPIVLMKKRETNKLAFEIAPNQNKFGVMLPYAPLHFLIFPKDMDYLVMTSGNLSGSPICFKDNEAFEMLRGIADYFLYHDREIIVPIDDSVVKVVNGVESVVRCGRGYAPLNIPYSNRYKVLALGSEQKSSICITGNDFATSSQYIGDLKEYKTYKAFIRQIEYFKNVFQYFPEAYAHDLNSDYLSSCYAKETLGRKVAVQHHHAHMAGCMAENKLKNNAIGVIYDGTGFGTDEAIWGGEFFSGSLHKVKREGHLKYVKLQGGDSAVKEPWRCAVSYLFDLGVDPKEFFPLIDRKILEATNIALKNEIRCYKSSSMGRLFDCVAALCGFYGKTTYDAQAAIELESFADTNIDSFYPYEIIETNDIFVLSYDVIIKEILHDIKNNIPKSLISSKFHNTVAEASAKCVCKISKNTGYRDVVLSGGVFDNTYLLKKLVSKLRNLEFNVYYNRVTPANDGGISFGQAVIANEILKEEGYVPGYSG